MNRYGKRAALGAGCGAVSTLVPVVAFGSINALVFVPKFALIGGAITLGITLVQDVIFVLRSKFGTNDI